MVVWARHVDVNAAVTLLGLAPFATVLAENPETPAVHTPSTTVVHKLQTWQAPTVAEEVFAVPHNGFAALYPAPLERKQVSDDVPEPEHYKNPNLY